MELTNLTIPELAAEARHARRIGDSVYLTLVMTAWTYVDDVLYSQVDGGCLCCWNQVCADCGYCHLCSDDDLRPRCITEEFV